MNYTECLQNLRQSLRIKENNQGLTHNINNKCPILPFPTRKPERDKFARGFEGVMGEFSRILCGQTLSQEVDIESVIESISNKVDMDEEDRPYFIRLIRMFLTDDKQAIKIFHPHILQYIPLTTGNEGKGEAKIAQFLRDVMVGEDQSLCSVFTKSETDHLVAKLILDQLDYMEPKEKEMRYQGEIPSIREVFREDISFLVKHNDYFVGNINLFLAYYYFFYITQLTLKLNQGKKADYSQINEVIYTLDWEGTSKSRVGYERGYHQIKDSARNLLVHVNCLEHLNFLFGTEQENYVELLESFDHLSEQEQNELLNILKKWVQEYRYHVSLLPLTSIQDDFEGLISALTRSLEEGIPGETKSRYALSIEEIGKKYFLKTRGALGYMLNASQDFLLLLTAISVKDTRKSLKYVFVEFERRGVFFDRHSQEAIVQLFDKLNLLDKKSDSGDAQYVKPIL